MSKYPVRPDKTCLNCRYVVDARYCSNCGQENTETRKTFHHLFIHFFEDLTHYENAFWKTIRNLITRPGSLTREYLSGRRMSYLAPVRLYIFISFVTFLVVAILSGKSDNSFESPMPQEKGFNYSVGRSQPVAVVQDSLQSHSNENTRLQLGDSFFSSQRELDSIQKYGKPEERLSPVGYWFSSKLVHVIEHNTISEIREKFTESLTHNIPKVLFIYMPCFAFVLWLFHNKKRWFYFDHGIFTLHYFSFLLLGTLVYNLFSALIDLLPDHFVVNIVDVFVSLGILGYMIYYFFPAHHRFYGGKRRVTVVKGICMLLLNSLFAGIIMAAFVIYTFINIR